MEINKDTIIGHLRAGYRISSIWRLWALGAVFGMAIPSLLMIFIVGEKPQFIYTGISLAALLAYVWITIKYEGAKSAAHTARRTAILINGLNANVSPAEELRLSRIFCRTKASYATSLNPSYYASIKPPGNARLVELVEESAFYTRVLQRSSAFLLAMLFAVLLIAIGVGIFYAIPNYTTSELMLSIRIIAVVFVSLLSSEVFVAAYRHLQCAMSCDEIFNRAQSYSVAGKDDAFAAMAIVEDYTSAVESAPEILPFIFKSKSRELSKQWDRYFLSRISVA